MKLSEALREGAKGRRQLRWHMFSEDGAACCALGAILLGLCGLDAVIHRRKDNAEQWSDFLLSMVPDGDVRRKIVNLNDLHEHTFEQIAQCLEAAGI